LLSLSVRALPSGVTLGASGSSTNWLSGPPTMTGTAFFTIHVTDATGSTTQQSYTVNVN
jgi:hypothetical protein